MSVGYASFTALWPFYLTTGAVRRRLLGAYKREIVALVPEWSTVLGCTAVTSERYILTTVSQDNNDTDIYALM